MPNRQEGDNFDHPCRSLHLLQCLLLLPDFTADWFWALRVYDFTFDRLYGLSMAVSVACFWLAKKFQGLQVYVSHVLRPTYQHTDIPYPPTVYMVFYCSTTVPARCSVNKNNGTIWVIMLHILLSNKAMNIHKKWVNGSSNSIFVRRVFRFIRRVLLILHVCMVCSHHLWTVSVTVRGSVVRS